MKKIISMTLALCMMLLATFAPKEPYWALAIFVAFFTVMNIILFRRKIFKRRKKNAKSEEAKEEVTTKEEKSE